MIIVSDTSIISYLIQLGEVELLAKIFGKVIIPEKVLDELLQVESHIEVISELAWVEIRPISDLELFRSFLPDLDPGEAEAITLAIELEADFLLIDERKGRNIARSQGLLITGLLGVLVEAKSLGYISSVKDHVDQLINEMGFRLHKRLYEEVLKSVGE